MNQPNRPAVTCDPRIQFGAPCIRGVPVEAATGNLWAGDTPAAVCADYGLTRPELLIAVWFMQFLAPADTFRGPWKRAWKTWAQQPAVARALHTGHGYDALPDPPSRDEVMS